MELLMNVTTAWISVALAVILSIIWVLRVVIKREKIRRDHPIYRLNRKLRTMHRLVGISFVVVGLIHGLLSSVPVMSFNKGTLIVALGIVMGSTYYFRKKFRSKAFWIRLHRVLTVAVLLLIPIHLVEVGGIIGFETLALAMKEEPVEVVMIADQTDLSANTYADGVYTGTATGYRAGLTVEVEIEDNEITKVEIVDHNEVGERFYLSAFESIPQQILQSQCLDVDVVTGSTCSSVGIANAVADALNQAMVSGEEIAMSEIELSETEHGGRGKNRRHSELENESYEQYGVSDNLQENQELDIED